MAEQLLEDAGAERRRVDGVADVVGPTLFAGLSKPLDLTLVSRLEFGSGAVAMRYVPRR
jgi:hypothetical protein